jgi:hypothetical protein
VKKSRNPCAETGVGWFVVYNLSLMDIVSNQLLKGLLLNQYFDEKI